MSRRTVLAIPLTPIAGDRFQPTGFPDLGPAQFQAPDPTKPGQWVAALHVESPQSMANRLELTTWDLAEQEQMSDLAGLPYVRVVAADGTFLTSSRLEAHRLAAAYIMDGSIEGRPGREVLAQRLGLAAGKAMDHRAMARAICTLDPLSLVHGVFFAQKAWPWQPKIARAVTCFIDAVDVQQAVSGGVKTDSVNPRVDAKAAGEGATGRGTAEGYGMVPHQRVEFTAQRITAHVVVDHDQIHSYGLGDDGEELLMALVDYELAQLFKAGSLRLRTACDLTVASNAAAALDAIPEPEAATARVRSAIAAAESLLGPVTRVQWTKGKGGS